MSELFLGIDTSNYTTSSALFDGSGVLENRKMLLPVKQGEKGLRQSDAVFHHVRQLLQVLGPLLEGLEDHPKAIGVSLTPTTEEGSYMPCFLVGKNTAGLLGRRGKSPWRDSPTSRATLRQHCYSAGKLELLEERFLAFHVSGGTTEALLVNPGEKGGAPSKTGGPFFGFESRPGSGPCGRHVGAWVSMRPGVGTAGLEVGTRRSYTARC